MSKQVKQLLPNLLWLALVGGLVGGLILILNDARAKPTVQGQARTPVAVTSTPTISVLPGIFSSPLEIATPLVSPTSSWNWQPTATALAQITSTPIPTPVPTPFGGPTTPTPAVDPPPPTMAPPAVFRVEELEVADVRFVDFDAHYRFVGWSPDGTHVLVEPYDLEHWETHQRLPGKKTGLFGLWLMKPDGSERRQIAEWAARSVAWSPDGKYIAYSTPFKQEGADAKIYVIDVETFKSRKVAKTNQFVGWEDLYWLPNNELVFLNDGYMFAVQADGKGTRQLNDIYIRPESAEHLVPGHYRVSPDGQKVAWIPGENTRELWVANLDGSDKILVSDNTSRKGAARAIAWSPDSQYLAFTVRHSRETTGGDLWVANVDGSDPHPIATTEREWESLGQPIWSPDGQVIAFVRGASQMDSTLWMVNRDGTGLGPLGGERIGRPHYPHWSPTGTQIAYTRQFWEPSGLPNAAVITLQQQP